MSDVFRDSEGRWFERMPAGGVGGGVAHTYHRPLTADEAAAQEAALAPPPVADPPEAAPEA